MSDLLSVPLESFVKLKKTNENRVPVKATRKTFLQIDDKDIKVLDTKKKVGDETFLSEVSSFLNRSDYKKFELDAHINEAYIALTSRFKHLNGLSKEYFLETPQVKTMFAKLVALCVRSSMNLAGGTYELDKMYLRLNLEKKKVMNWFRVHTVDRDFSEENYEANLERLVDVNWRQKYKREIIKQENNRISI
ncbi:MAG: hypothetical protein CMF41_07065 [Legionellales bacterium]|nr:hypothetical protein [Legionellales bacterium]OUX63556.1 MAG: hypothetical protein CBE41_04690 [Gammaproteobacteria bacterium TMED281]|tara:strand:+ start:2615 stop:3190 length:576 start_codon:yes stop_codon:yes gene_type:complete